MKNSILANSVGIADCFNFVNGTAISITGNNNLIQTDGDTTNACGTTTPINNADPKLGTPTGFPTPEYLPLLADSPAIDKGNDANCAAAPVNNTAQNGVARPQGPHCDIGAYEATTKANTTTTLVAAPNPSVVGQSMFLTATISAVSGSPSGAVTFSAGGNPLGSGPISSGVATFSTTALISGTHVITAAYSGDSAFNASTSTALTLTVNATSKAKTTTTLTVAPKPLIVGQPQVFTVTVTGPGGTPTGTVNLTILDRNDGDYTDITQPISLSAGVAVFVVPNPLYGIFAAFYRGSDSFEASYGFDEVLLPSPRIWLPLVRS